MKEGRSKQGRIVADAGFPPSFDICVSFGQIGCWFHREGRGEREAVLSWEGMAERSERRRKNGGAS